MYLKWWSKGTDIASYLVAKTLGIKKGRLVNGPLAKINYDIETGSRVHIIFSFLIMINYIAFVLMIIFSAIFKVNLILQ